MRHSARNRQCEMSDSAYLPPAVHGQKKLMPVTFSLEQEEMERTV